MFSLSAAVERVEQITVAAVGVEESISQQANF